MQHQNEGRGLACEEHLSNISAFHITTHSAQPVYDRGSKDVTGTARAVLQVKLLSLNILDLKKNQTMSTLYLL